MFFVSGKTNKSIITAFCCFFIRRLHSNCFFKQCNIFRFNINMDVAIYTFKELRARGSNECQDDAKKKSRKKKIRLFFFCFTFQANQCHRRRKKENNKSLHTLIRPSTLWHSIGVTFF